MPPSLIVVGAGMAGLSAAHRARQLGADVRVFEASARAGGVVETVRDGGWTADLGPNSAAERPALRQLVADLGLADRRREAAEGARYVAWDGQPVALPRSPLGLARTPLLSRRGRLRLLTEPFRRRARRDDESLAGFVTRRLGPEVLAAAVDPFVAGVYAGDVSQLSVRHAFPRLWEMERRHGSLLRGALRGRRARAPRAPSVSFADGMQMLPDALAADLGDRLRLGARVAAAHPEGAGWRVELASGETHAADRLLLAVPVHRLDGLLPHVPSSVAAVTSPPVAVHALGFRRGDVAHALDGLGVLVPSREPLPLLGALFSSTMFPGRAPDGHVLLTAFVGGTRQPDLARAPAPEREARVLDALGALLGVRAAPVWSRTRLWRRAIPQYTLGHGLLLDALRQLEADHPGLGLAGSYRGGIALADAAASGRAAAERLVEA